jgi:hypothetical protein
MLDVRSVTAAAFGRAVWPALLGGGLRPAGVTSRGLFLLAGCQGMVYVTTDPARGPLTVNLDGELPWPVGGVPEAGWAVDVERRCLRTGTGGIHLPAEAEWCAAPPCSRPDPDGAPGRLRALVARLAAVTTAHESVEILEEVAGMRKAPSAAPASLGPHVPNLLRAFHSESPERIKAALTATLGCGRGLTPTGDDVVMGALLAGRRWGGGPLTRAFGGSMAPLVRRARERTTRLSACLIECAMQGEADERLLALADHIWTGAPPAEAALGAVLGWGASSGVDALLGMALVLLAGHPDLQS